MSENSRIAKNTLLLYIRMLIVLAVNLYISRLVLKNLGIDDYGLYTVVGGVATMFMFLNSAMNSSSQRFLSIAITKNDEDELQKVFNISRSIHVLLGVIVVLICELVGVWFIYNKMTIPDGREIAVFWTFQFSLLATFFTIISVPYNALLISKEKMGAFAFISIIDVFFRLLVAIFLSFVVFDRLIIYSLLIAISQIIVRLIYSIYCNKEFKECKWKSYRKDPLYKEMIEFASWGLLGHFSSIINTSVQDMMLNTFFSPIINAAKGIANQVSSGITGFSYNFQLSVEPQITKSYTRGEKERTFSLIYNTSRFSKYLLWLLSLPIILCVNEVLDIWLVEVPDYAVNFIVLVLINNVVCSSSNPLNIAIRAHGIIKYSSIVGGVILILNLPVSYVALKLGCSPNMVFYIMIVISVLAQVSRIYFAHLYLQMPVLYYLKVVTFKPLFVLILSSIVPYIVSIYCLNEVGDFTKLCIVTLCSTVSILLAVFYIGMNSDERKFLIGFIKKKVSIWFHV